MLAKQMFKCFELIKYYFSAYFHHKNGFLTVGKPPYQPLVEEFLQGCEWSGIPRVDLNAPYTEGKFTKYIFPHKKPIYHPRVFPPYAIQEIMIIV